MKTQPSSRSKKTILLVDDVDASRLTTKWFLANFDYAVEAVHNAEEALALFDPKVHDVVITGNTMPGMSGAELAHAIKQQSPSTAVVMYSGAPSEDQACLDLVIHKPTHLLVLKDALDKLLAEKGRDSRRAVNM